MRLSLQGAVLGLSLLPFWPLTAQAEVQLLMFEQPGCRYCAQWNRQIGPKYPLTTEGQQAPLMRIDIHATLPDGITLRSAPVFTPTFVLVQDGVEVDRIEGYPGEDFFWGFLDMMIAKTSEQMNSD